MDQFHGQAAQLFFGAGAPFAQHQIGGLQNRLNPARSPAAHIAGLYPVIAGKRAHHRAVLAMRSDRQDQGFGTDMHLPGYTRPNAECEISAAAA